MRDRLDPAEIIFQIKMLIRSMRVFVRQSASNENARNLEWLMHLCDQRNRSAFANEDRFLAESLFQRCLRLREYRRVERSNPRLSRTQNFKLHLHCFWN